MDDTIDRYLIRSRCAFHSQNAPGDHEESPHAQNPKTGGIPEWASLNTGVYWPVGLYFPKAGATELYSLYRLCVITEQRQEGCSALKQHNPTSNPHSNHLLPPSEKERLTERGMDGCRPEAKIHRSEFFSPRPIEYGTGVKVPSCSPEWLDGW
ncbi:unnamed protein product [Leuciscus chuanchicus]